ncbi:DUF11 domain-containing protein [Deinococcus malanensis]|uniref:DUF11 domain-containing protein n=1 Tax=Deinococcus malanensis TaxID=1706855 RepID=UPI00166C5853|nr:DUF11 domain-containing protein [Deinococcus malanensis]
MKKRTTFLLSVCLLGAAAAQSTKAGTTVTNQAAATFKNTTGQSLPAVLSRTVTSTVLPMPGFDTVYRDGRDGRTIGNSATGPLPAGYEADVRPGGELLTPYTLVNSGNTDQVVTLTSVATGSPSTGHAVAYYLDTDGDGLLSAPERAAGPVTRVALRWNDPGTPADEGLSPVIQVLQVPAIAPAGSVYAASPAATGQLLRDRTPVTVQENATQLELQFSRAVVKVDPPVCAVSVTPDGTVTAPGQMHTALPGSSGLFSYTLRNDGQTAVDVPVRGTVLPGSAALPDVQVVLDSNRNGQADAGEGAVHSVRLAVNQTAHLLLVIGRVPVAGDVNVNLTASCPDGTQDGNNVALLRVGSLGLTKTVDRPVVVIGDRLTYTLALTNRFPGTTLHDIKVTDTPQAGLSYIPGTSSLNGQPIADPVAQNGALIWTVPSLADGTSATIAYAMRVSPVAGTEVRNTVTAQGRTVSGASAAFASAQAAATAKVQGPLNFAPVGDIVGRVFIDTNGNRMFDAGVDTAVPLARILLAGGREVRTDAQGRYSFTNVAMGTHALRLDPASVPFRPLPTPDDGGLSGTRTVQVRGLSTVDFPLGAPVSLVSATRQISVTLESVTLDKTVTLESGSYLVQVKARNTGPAGGASITDPLPPGALLSAGSNTWTGMLPPGDTTFSYRFTWTGNPGDVTTIPSLTWRK